MFDAEQKELITTALKIVADHDDPSCCFEIYGYTFIQGNEYDEELLKLLVHSRVGENMRTMRTMLNEALGKPETTIKEALDKVHAALRSLLAAGTITEVYSENGEVYFRRPE